MNLIAFLAGIALAVLLGGGAKAEPLELKRYAMPHLSSSPQLGQQGLHLVIVQAERKLYLMHGSQVAKTYRVAVGKDGFRWSGVHKITKKAEWPDWRPPAAMLERQPQLPRFMAGGPGNPLGAMALYIGQTEYRIHGSNLPESIGQAVSSGCFRMKNEDVVDLANRVPVGTTIIVR